MIKVVKDEQRLININPLVVYFVLPENEHSKYSDDIKRLNKYVGYTREIFKFESLLQGNIDSAMLPISIRKEFYGNNTIVRLVDATDGSFVYSFAHIDVNDDPRMVEASIIDLVIDLCKYNIQSLEMLRKSIDSSDPAVVSKLNQNIDTSIEIFNRAINKSRFKRAVWGDVPVTTPCMKSISDSFAVHGFTECVLMNNLPTRIKPQREISASALRTYDFIKEQFGEDNMQKILTELLSSLNPIPDFDESKAIAEGIVNDKYADTVRADYNRRFGPKYKPSLRISVKKITAKLYGKDSKKYGVEIEVNGTSYTIYFKSKDQTMLYLTTLLRHKIGQPLYIHELYHNSKETHSRYRREKSKPWLRSVYNNIYRYASKSFDEWFNGVDERHGKALHQGKSRVVDIIKTTLHESPEAIEYCTINTLKDCNQESYYCVKCSPDDIVLDQEMQKLCSEFERLYS